MLELYHHGSSVCAAKARLALAEKGLEWTGRYVDILKGEQFEPDFLALNPRAVVPVLVDGGRVIVESTVICEYLEERFPDPRLMPDDPGLRADLRVWTKSADEHLHPACGVITMATNHRHSMAEHMEGEALEAFLDAVPDPVRRARKKEAVLSGFASSGFENAVLVHLQYLDKMEAALADGGWLVGDAYSLADLAMTPYVNRLNMLRQEHLWTGRRPRLAEWFARIRARPSFAAAVLGPVPADLAESLARNGAAAVPVYRETIERLGGG